MQNAQDSSTTFINSAKTGNLAEFREKEAFSLELR